MINTTDIDDTIVVIVDVQDRMMSVIHEGEALQQRIATLVRGARILGLPILTTEQYPSGLGATTATVQEALGDEYAPLEKMSFSAAKDRAFLQAFEASGRHQILLCGVEAHVCVYQTARDLHNLGYTVEVVADAIGSRHPQDRNVALDRLKHHGIDFTTVEMTLFDMMETAEYERFKEISALVK